MQHERKETREKRGETKRKHQTITPLTQTQSMKTKWQCKIGVLLGKNERPWLKRTYNHLFVFERKLSLGALVAFRVLGVKQKA